MFCCRPYLKSLAGYPHLFSKIGLERGRHFLSMKNQSYRKPPKAWIIMKSVWLEEIGWLFVESKIGHFPREVKTRPSECTWILRPSSYIGKWLDSRGNRRHFFTIRLNNQWFMWNSTFNNSRRLRTDRVEAKREAPNTLELLEKEEMAIFVYSLAINRALTIISIPTSLGKTCDE